MSIARNKSAELTITVWDPFVRIFHWSLVTAFTVAYLTSEDFDAIHQPAGYVVVALIAGRIVWGLIGTEHARFTNFMYAPSTIIAFLRDSLHLKAKRYLGHNPAGGAMVVALLIMISGICATGILMTSDAYHDAKWLKEFHELLANTTLALVALHIGGVALASYEQGENLVRSMFTGKKRP